MIIIIKCTACKRVVYISSNKGDLHISSISYHVFQLAEIIYMNDVIRKHQQTGAKATLLMEDWDFLQLQVSIIVAVY